MTPKSWRTDILVLPLLLALLPANLIAQEGKALSQQSQEGFRGPEKSKTFTSAELLTQFDAGDEKGYALGEGDELTIEVWDHPELSGKHTVRSNRKAFEAQV